MLRLRLWVVRMLPFLERWVDAVPAACCGTCPTCVGTAAAGVATHVVATLRKTDDG